MYKKVSLLIRAIWQWVVLLLATAFIVSLLGCGREVITEKTFVGKWKSSKLETPIYLYSNGEWEIKKDDGAILQYGVWQYQGTKITWSYKVNSYIGHDTNAVLSATPMEFQVKENDGTATTFIKLEDLK